MMVRWRDSNGELLFPLVPKGWMPIVLIIFTILSFLVFSAPLVASGKVDVYTALTPYMFVVTFLFMFIFSPVDTWKSFKETFEFDAETSKEKLFAIAMIISGGMAGYLTYYWLSRGGLTILSFPSGSILLNMGTLIIILTFFFVGFYEEIFHVWFSKVSANNVYPIIRNRETSWIIGILIGGVCWTFIHIVAVGVSLPAFLFIFSLGTVLRLPSLLIAKPMGREFYSIYFAVAFHVVFDCGQGLHLAFLL